MTACHLEIEKSFYQRSKVFDKIMGLNLSPDNFSLKQRRNFKKIEKFTKLGNNHLYLWLNLEHQSYLTMNGVHSFNVLIISKRGIIKSQLSKKLLLENNTTLYRVKWIS